jgi:hypothetical protein
MCFSGEIDEENSFTVENTETATNWSIAYHSGAAWLPCKRDVSASRSEGGLPACFAQGPSQDGDDMITAPADLQGHRLVRRLLFRSMAAKRVRT